MVIPLPDQRHFFPDVAGLMVVATDCQPASMEPRKLKRKKKGGELTVPNDAGC